MTTPYSTPQQHQSTMGRTMDDQVPEGADPMPLFVGTVKNVWSGQVGRDQKSKLRFTIERHYPWRGRDGTEQIGSRFYEVELWEAEADANIPLVTEGAYIAVSGEPTSYEETYEKNGEQKTKRGMRLVSARVDQEFLTTRRYDMPDLFADFGSDYGLED